MKVKELYKKYIEYDIVLFGKPLNQSTIPFTHLPKDKELMDCEVVEFKVEETPFTSIGIKFNDLKTKVKYEYKGNIYAYIR